MVRNVRMNAVRALDLSTVESIDVSQVIVLNLGLRQRSIIFPINNVSFCLQEWASSSYGRCSASIEHRDGCHSQQL